MKKASLTEIQIVNILKLADFGMKVEDIFREAGICEASYNIYGLPSFYKYRI
ncbi:hypothetical protein [Proteus mirabilis]|uniref:hypothetical protein n=1 Tax=Proteus mirabilis TaxID=584 RepID=UPI003F716612|nr:hypothetical protein [Proteus mirabilis]MCI9754218.1 hypothetical protein [Proteus mirabilis]MCI9764895.1 hypothetical protein [Proteus mirabilis]